MDTAIESTFGYSIYLYPFGAKQRNVGNLASLCIALTGTKSIKCFGLYIVIYLLSLVLSYGIADMFL